MFEEITTTPSVLKWARERSGYSEDEVVKHLREKRVSDTVFRQWELGKIQPTYPQLKKLAKLYKRPVALFFFPNPPEEEPIEKDFRKTLSAENIIELSPRMRYLVRLAKVKMINLEELLDSTTSNAPVIHLKSKQNETAEQLAKRIRNEIGISISTQANWNNIDTALKNWRRALENLGIWIFKDAFGKAENDYCGFCLYNERFPIIYINNSHAPQRQIFTLFHELGHLLKSVAGIDFRRTPTFTERYEKEEVFCNAFAGEFLVPKENLAQYSLLPTKEEIQYLALTYKVSFDVILRKFLDKEFIAKKTYEDIIQHRKPTNKEKTKGGGSYYLNQRMYLGQKYMQLAFGQYHKQRIDRFQLADYLDVNVKSIATLEGYMIEEMG